MSTGASVAGRKRSRETRLAKARHRRLQLDPKRAARDKSIDEATLDIEDARTQHLRAEAAVMDAEQAIASGVTRLFAEKLTLAEIAGLTGMKYAEVRRLRQRHCNEHGSAQGSATS